MDVRAIEGDRSPTTNPLRLQHAALFLQRSLLQLGFTVRTQPVTRFGSTSHNVIAEREGTLGPRAPVVLVGAHYDTVPFSPGADDNASGVAGVLAVARVVTAVRTRATVRLVAFTEEERDLGGSRVYVESLSRQERARIRGAIVMDMIGYTVRSPGSQSYPRELSLVDLPHELPRAGTFLAAFSLLGEGPVHRALLDARSYVRGLHVETLVLPRFLLGLMSDLSRSDHAPFWLAGIPAVSLTDTADFRSPHYHRYTDRSATLDVHFATRSARLAAATALILAEIDEPQRCDARD